MRHFTEEHVDKEVVDARGERLGRIVGVEDGTARVKPRTGVQSRMDAALDPDEDALDIAPEQVVEFEPEYVRIEIENSRKE